MRPIRLPTKKPSIPHKNPPLSSVLEGWGAGSGAGGGAGASSGEGVCTGSSEGAGDIGKTPGRSRFSLGGRGDG